MNKNPQEIEAKFYLKDLPRLEKMLQTLGAELVHPRVHEINLRFDTPEGILRSTGRVLRLRRDSTSHLTFKGTPEPSDQVSIRREIEFEVSDFDTARSFLEMLGYHVVVWYEKHRTTYLLAGVLVTLDELPYGNFCELEGMSAPAIQKAAKLLKLDWDARCTESYLALFDHLRAGRNLSVQNLSFEELSGMTFKPEELGVRPADHSTTSQP